MYNFSVVYNGVIPVNLIEWNNTSPEHNYLEVRRNFSKICRDLWQIFWLIWALDLSAFNLAISIATYSIRYFLKKVYMQSIVIENGIILLLVPIKSRLGFEPATYWFLVSRQNTKYHWLFTVIINWFDLSSLIRWPGSQTHEITTFCVENTNVTLSP